MATLNEVQTLRGKDVIGPDGEKVGTLEDVYLDRQSGEPGWAAVKTGLFGTKLHFVPLEGATPNEGTLRVSFDRSKIKDAPNVDADGNLSPEEEARLYEYYGRSDYSGWNGQSDATEGSHGRDETHSRGDGHDTAGPSTDDAMTRSEEELQVGTTAQPARRARLRKWVETENVSTTVPVQREEARIEREPITEGNVGNAVDGPALSVEQHELTLNREEVMVDRTVVPKERVRLTKDTFTEEQQVDDEVRKERIEAEGDVTSGREGHTRRA